MKKQSQPKSFEQAMQELDEIVSQMEGGDLPLEQMLAAYKRGAQLVQFCRQQLEQAQMEVKKLEDNELADYDDGKSG